MKKIFSILIFAFAIVLLVPNNGAQAIGGGLAAVTSDPQPAFASPISLSTRSPAPDPSVAWILALGFLGLVVVRRTGE
jgi:hypothetical protein